jgi:hypothetical protein
LLAAAADVAQQGNATGQCNADGFCMFHHWRCEAWEPNETELATSKLLSENQTWVPQTFCKGFAEKKASMPKISFSKAMELMDFEGSTVQQAGAGRLQGFSSNGRPCSGLDCVEVFSFDRKPQA